MMRIEKNKKGFTLIELLVVVAIIGILAAIAIPQFSKYRTRAYNSSAQSDLRNVQTALEGWFADYQKYPVITDVAASDTVARHVSFTDADATTDNVTLSLNVGVKPFVTTAGSTYSIATKHETGGDKCYGAADNKPSVVETDSDLAKIGTASALCATDPAD